MKMVTQSDLIAALLSYPEKDRITVPGEIVQYHVYSGDKDHIIRADGDPTEVIFYPSTKPGYMILKAFYAPFPPKNYYENVSFEDVFMELKKQIEQGVYQTLALRPFEYFIERVKDILQSENIADQKQLLKFCLSVYPHDFLYLNLSQTLSLKKLFANIIYGCKYESDSSKRKVAKDTLESILERPPGIKSSKDKKSLPPYLYLGGLFEYLHKITTYLKAQHINSAYGYEPLSKNDADEYKKIDKRLVYICKNGQIKKLLVKPKEFTYELMAKLFNYSPDKISKKIEEERRFSKSPEKAPSNLVHVDTSYNRIPNPSQIISQKRRKK